MPEESEHDGTPQEVELLLGRALHQRLARLWRRFRERFGLSDADATVECDARPPAVRSGDP